MIRHIARPGGGESMTIEVVRQDDGVPRAAVCACGATWVRPMGDRHADTLAKWAREHVHENHDQLSRCKVCGLKFRPYNGRKYCSDACRQKAYRRRQIPAAGRPEPCGCHLCWRARTYHRALPHKAQKLF